MKNVLDTLKERGYVKQTVYEDELYELLGKESVSFYIGFDPTADSLHVGHFVQLMAMSIMQKAGHRPVILIGGGTGKIGDPSGKRRRHRQQRRLARRPQLYKVFARSGRLFLREQDAHRRML